MVWDPASVVCQAFPAIPDNLEICFPGGFCLSNVYTEIGKIPSAADIPLQLFSQLGPAMAPLAPFFTQLDTILALFKCANAVPDAIASLDPGAIFECIPELVEKINELLSLIPQLSLPKMVKALIIALAQLLEGIAADFTYLQNEFQRALDAIDRAADLSDVTLSGFLQCRQDNLATASDSMAAALQGIGRIILLINIMMGLFGGPEVPCFSDAIDPNVLEPLIAFLLALAAFLRQLAALIPDPQLAITLALGDQRC